MSGMSRMAFIVIFIAAYGQLSAEVATQTNWVGGPGEPGPVTDFGIRFDSSVDIMWLYVPGELRLAIEADWTPDPVNVEDDRWGFYSCQTGDLDGDGDNDIVAAGQDADVVFYENYGDGVFAEDPVVLIEYYWPSIEVVDFRNDGFADLLFTDDAYVYLYLNKNQPGGIPPEFETYVISEYYYQVDGTGTADFDRDGDLDFVASCYQNYALKWFENPSIWPPTDVWPEHQILANYRGHNNAPLPVGDLNGDDYPDFVICREYPGELDWWENLGPPDYFTPASQHNIATGIGGIRNGRIADLDLDGDNDIVTCANIAGSIDWWENDGTGNFTRHNIDASYAGAWDLAVNDIDWDGDNDIFSTARYGNTVDAWENDGTMDFASNRHTIASGYTNATGIWLATLTEGDNKLEVIACSYDGSLDYWVTYLGFKDSGQLTSSIYDATQPRGWDYFDCTVQEQPGATYEFYVKGSNDYINMGEWKGPLVEPDTDLSIFLPDPVRYIQYRCDLATTNPSNSCRVKDVSFGYDYDVGIELEYFSAAGVPKGVELGWSVSGEHDITGFNLYRRPLGSERTLAVLSLVNAEPITGASPYEYFDVTVVPGTVYEYYLEALDASGDAQRFGPYQVEAGSDTEVKAFGLGQNSPNPAAGTTSVPFELAADCPVDLSLFDLAGRKVAVVYKGFLAAGSYEVPVDCSALAPGIYIYRLRAGEFSAARKMVVQ